MEMAKLAYRFKSHPVSGHEAAPDNNANQPLVMGKGPWCMRRTNPPTPARSAQAHPTMWAMTVSVFSTIAVSAFTLLLRHDQVRVTGLARMPFRQFSPSQGTAERNRAAFATWIHTSVALSIMPRMNSCMDPIRMI